MGCEFKKPLSGYKSWDQLMLKASSADISKTMRNSTDLSTTLFYMFTSGTTGKMSGFKSRSL